MGSGNGQDAFDALVDQDFVKIAGFPEIADTWHGVITDARWVQSRSYDDENPGKGDLLFWHDKKPKPIPNDEPVMELHIVFQTDVREDEDDDGRREIWLNKYQIKKAFEAAWKGAGASKPRLGDWWRVTRTNDVAPRKGPNKARGWEILYKLAATYEAEGPSDSPYLSGTIGEKPTVKAGRKPKEEDPFATA